MPDSPFARIPHRFRDRRLPVIFVLGMASGFPWVLTGSAMSGWLKDLGVSRSAIGLVGVVGIVYALNFLWAPFLDRFRPWLLAGLGRRRSWLLALQFGLALLTLWLSRMHPGEHLLLTGMVLLLIALCSATQDVVIDAYRVELIDRSETDVIAYGAAMATAGWWTGYGLLGALPFVLVDSLPGGWSTAYAGMALFWFGFMAFVWRLGEPAFAGAARPYRGLGNLVFEPLQEFLARNGVRLALAILGFVLLFKIGEAFLGRMSIVFYREVGFSNAEIGVYSKVVNWWVTVIFSILGSLVNARFGIVRGLLVGGIAMASTNLMFAWLAATGPEAWLLVLTVIVDGFTAALGTIAFMSFITFMTSHSFTAAQYALLASIGNLGRTTLASSGGFVVDWLGGNWPLFFILTAVAVIPSLVLLLRMLPWLEQRYPGAWRGGGTAAAAAQRER